MPTQTGYTVCPPRQVLLYTIQGDRSIYLFQTQTCHVFAKSFPPVSPAMACRQSQSEAPGDSREAVYLHRCLVWVLNVPRGEYVRGTGKHLHGIGLNEGIVSLSISRLRRNTLFFF